MHFSHYLIAEPIVKRISRVIVVIKVMCNLEGRGWFVLRISDGINEVDIKASYLSDSPADIISSVRTVLDGSRFARCSCQDEPGEHRFIFDKNNEMINIRVLEFTKSFNKESNDIGNLIFEGTDNLYTFAKRIKRQYDRLLYNHGLEGYRSIWGYDFPISELARLNESIETYRPGHN